MARRLAARSMGIVPSGAASISNRAAPDARSQKTKPPGCSVCAFAGIGSSTGFLRVLFRTTSRCPDPRAAGFVDPGFTVTGTRAEPGRTRVYRFRLGMPPQPPQPRKACEQGPFHLLGPFPYREINTLLQVGRSGRWSGRELFSPGVQNLPVRQ